jgi:hypothetical protein
MMAKIQSWNPGSYECADINGDQMINIFDITDLISFLYIGGSPPVPPTDGDVNGDLDVNIFDITFLISYLYISGPPPVCR